MDGISSYAMFLYLDEGIRSSTSHYPEVGYDARDGVNTYWVPGSGTPSILDIETTSNVFIPGKYVFQLSYPPGKVNISL